ncbi:MAG: hypothetical protein AAFY03_09390, partial [Pseudomonadota bacterium]
QLESGLNAPFFPPGHFDTQELIEERMGRLLLGHGAVENIPELVGGIATAQSKELLAGLADVELRLRDRFCTTHPSLFRQLRAVVERGATSASRW